MWKAIVVWGHGRGDVGRQVIEVSETEIAVKPGVIDALWAGGRVERRVQNR